MAERIVFGDENAFHAVTPNSYGSAFSRISITVLRCVVSGCQKFVLRTSTHSNPPVVHTGSARAKGRRAEKFSFIDAWFTEFATPRKQKFYSHWKKEFVTFQGEKTAERSAETRNSSDAPVDARLLHFFQLPARCSFCGIQCKQRSGLLKSRRKEGKSVHGRLRIALTVNAY